MCNRRDREDETGRLVYVLRSYPKASETFIAREIRGLVKAGVPLSVLTLEPGEAGAGASSPAAATPAPPVRCLSGPRGPDRPILSRAARGPAAILPTLLRDLARLGGRPRRSAHLLQLAALALRARDLLPADATRLHAHFANDAATVARYLSLLAGLPYGVTAHAYDIFQETALLGPNLAGADRVFTVSRANLEHLSSRARTEGWRAERFALLRCGIDLAEFTYRDPPPPRVPARLVCVARLIPKKGHAALLEALALLRAEGRSIELELIGEGPLRSPLEARAARADLAGAVRWLGSLPESQVAESMRGADVAVLASRIAEDGDRDGLPVVLVEAMALGVPVVGTRVAGIPELISEATGWLAPPDRPDLLAAALGEALAAPAAERIARARRARRVVESEYDVRRQVETIAGLLASGD